SVALVLLAVTAFASLLDEIAWTRVLAMIVGGSTYAFTLVLLVFLLGIGLGSRIVARGRLPPARTAAYAALAQAVTAAGASVGRGRRRGLRTEHPGQYRRSRAHRVRPRGDPRDRCDATRGRGHQCRGGPCAGLAGGARSPGGLGRARCAAVPRPHRRRAGHARVCHRARRAALEHPADRPRAPHLRPC